MDCSFISKQGYELRSILTFNLQFETRARRTAIPPPPLSRQISRNGSSLDFGLASSVEFHHANPRGLFRGGDHCHIGPARLPDCLPTFVKVLSDQISRICRSLALMSCVISNWCNIKRRWDLDEFDTHDTNARCACAIHAFTSHSITEARHPLKSICHVNWNCHPFDIRDHPPR